MVTCYTSDIAKYNCFHCLSKIKTWISSAKIQSGSQQRRTDITLKFTFIENTIYCQLSIHCVLTNIWLNSLKFTFIENTFYYQLSIHWELNSCL